MLPQLRAVLNAVPLTLRAHGLLQGGLTLTAAGITAKNPDNVTAWLNLGLTAAAGIAGIVAHFRRPADGRPINSTRAETKRQPKKKKARAAAATAPTLFLLAAAVLGGLAAPAAAQTAPEPAILEAQSFIAAAPNPTRQTVIVCTRSSARTYVYTVNVLYSDNTSHAYAKQVTHAMTDGALEPWEATAELVPKKDKATIYAVKIYSEAASSTPVVLAPVAPPPQ